MSYFDDDVKNELEEIVTEEQSLYQIYSLTEIHNSHVPEKRRCLSTSILSLDKSLNGLEDGRLYIVAAETGVGKSFLTLQFVLHQLLQNIPVGIISTEMPKEEIYDRLYTMYRMNSSEQHQQQLSFIDLPLYIFDGELRDDIRTEILACLANNVKLLVFDYIQSIPTTLFRSSKTDSVNALVSDLITVKKKYNIPVVAISSVTIKNSQGRKQLGFGDLKDSGQLAFDADCILFLYKFSEDSSTYREIEIAKLRYKRKTNIHIGLNFDGEKTYFTEVPLEREEEMPTNIKNRNTNIENIKLRLAGKQK